MDFEIRFRVDGHWRLKSYYEFKVSTGRYSGLLGVYRWYLEWLSNEQSIDNYSSVRTALIDYLVIDGVKIIDGDIFRMNSQTFRKVPKPVLGNKGD